MKTREELLCEKYGYDFVSSFSEGLAMVRKGTEWFHIRHDGSPAYEERYDEVGSFSAGLAWVQQGTEWFHIRSDGSRRGLMPRQVSSKPASPRHLA